MKTFSILAGAALVAAALATYVRYQSFDPCVWMEQDLAAKSGLPRLVARGRIQAQFLVEGVIEPDVGECITAWWDLRADGVPPKGS